MIRRRPATPTTSARRRRKPGVNLSFLAPALPSIADADHIAAVNISAGSMQQIEFDDYKGALRRALAYERIAWPVEQAREAFLLEVARLAPHVLKNLARLRSDSDRALTAWATRSGLNAPWILVVARNTRALWRIWPAARGREWDLDQHDEGALVPMRGRLPDRPPEILIRSEHLEWTVRRLVLREKLVAIAPHLSDETARKAVRTLAQLLGL